MDKLKDWWTGFSGIPGNRRKMLVVGVVWVLIHFVFTWDISVDNLIGIIFLILALKFFYMGTSVYMFMVSVFFFMCSHPVTSFGLVIITLYLFYKLLMHLREKRIKKIASMSASELSGVRFREPEVEVIIRGRQR